MQTRPTVFLFDIDGTLISADGAGRRALVRAFSARHGQAECLNFRFDGMTDPNIIEQALETLGVPRQDFEREQPLLLDLYLKALVEEVEQADQYVVHPGVVNALDELEARTGVAVGLGTGNLEKGAQIKLRRGNLAHRFSFGGFGSDHGVRAELLRIGAERGATRLGKSRSECRVVVIGDTPKDIHAAHAIGAECLAVATGHFSIEELKAHAPAFTARNLEEPDALLWLLGQAAT